MYVFGISVHEFVHLVSDGLFLAFECSVLLAYTHVAVFLNVVHLCVYMHMCVLIFVFFCVCAFVFLVLRVGPCTFPGN